MAMVDSGEGWRFSRFERETRYYELRLQQDLFGWVVVKVWGRKSSRLGQMRTTPCSSFLEASRLWDASILVRKRRGYVPTYRDARHKRGDGGGSDGQGHN